MKGKKINILFFLTFTGLIIGCIEEKKTGLQFRDSIAKNHISKTSYKNQVTFDLKTETLVKLSDNERIKIFREIDTSIILSKYEYATKEFFILQQKNENDIWKTIKPKTDFLDLICNKYYSVSILNKMFTVIKPCNQETPKIIIRKNNDDNYYLSYYENELVFSRKIISSSMSYNINYISDIEKYRGKYIQIWLMDTITDRIDNRFLAIGGANSSYVIEFHFSPEEYNIGLFFVSEENLLDNNVNVFEEECN